MPYSKVTGPKPRPNRGANVTGPKSRPVRLKPSEMNSGASGYIGRGIDNRKAAARVLTGSYASD